MNKLVDTAAPKPVICLMGPTASGKTALSLYLAQQFPVEIISVDSAMVYREMNIGTAKPDASILAQVPHHLIDIIDPTEAYSAATFRTDALALINQIHSRNKIPLLVGGTMLYFNTLLHGIAPLPSADPIIRQQLEQDIKQHGLLSLHQRLQQVDPIAAARINANDPQRIQRALEVYLITGKPMSQLWRNASSEMQAEHFPYKNLCIALIPEDRSKLHQLIERRFDAMLTAGFIAEVKRLKDKWHLDLTFTAMKTVGYRQAFQYLSGEFNEIEMRQKAIIATRQLAKRQLTWLRHFSCTDLVKFAVELPDVSLKVGKHIKKWLKI